MSFGVAAFAQLPFATVGGGIDVPSWQIIYDSQNANWATITTPQSPVWSVINDSQNPNWQNINTV